MDGEVGSGTDEEGPPVRGASEAAGTDSSSQRTRVRRKRALQESDSSDEESASTDEESRKQEVRRSSRTAQRPTAVCDGCHAVKTVPDGEQRPADLDYFICLECRETDDTRKHAAAASRQNTPDQGVWFVVACLCRWVAATAVRCKIAVINRRVSCAGFLRLTCATTMQRRQRAKARPGHNLPVLRANVNDYTMVLSATDRSRRG